MSNPPAGWYPNPEDLTTERWWTGTDWAGQTRPRPHGGAQPPPTGPSGAALANKPPNQLVWAILSTLFCCAPFGVASLVNAAKVDSLWMGRDYAGAHEASAKAKRWAMWAVAAAVALWITYAVVVVVALRDSESTQTEWEDLIERYEEPGE